MAREYDDDDTLVARAVAGDTTAFATLVKRYRWQVYVLTFRQFGDASEADEAAQATFVRAYTHLTDYRPGGQFASWLLALAARQCANQRQRRPGQERHLGTRVEISIPSEGVTGVAAGATRTGILPAWDNYFRARP